MVGLCLITSYLSNILSSSFLKEFAPTNYILIEKKSFLWFILCIWGYTHLQCFWIRIPTFEIFDEFSDQLHLSKSWVNPSAETKSIRQTPKKKEPQTWSQKYVINIIFPKLCTAYKIIIINNYYHYVPNNQESCTSIGERLYPDIHSINIGRLHTEAFYRILICLDNESDRDWRLILQYIHDQNLDAFAGENSTVNLVRQRFRNSSPALWVLEHYLECMELRLSDELGRGYDPVEILRGLFTDMELYEALHILQDDIGELE